MKHILKLIAIGAICVPIGPGAYAIGIVTPNCCSNSCSYTCGSVTYDSRCENNTFCTSCKTTTSTLNGIVVTTGRRITTTCNNCRVHRQRRVVQNVRPMRHVRVAMVPHLFVTVARIRVAVGARHVHHREHRRRGQPVYRHAISGPVQSVQMTVDRTNTRPTVIIDGLRIFTIFCGVSHVQRPRTDVRGLFLSVGAMPIKRLCLWVYLFILVSEVNRDVGVRDFKIP